MSTDGKDYADFVISRDYVLQVTAERDALRARIEAAPVVRARGKVGELCTVVVSHDLAGKRVRLVVEPDNSEAAA